MTIAVDFDGTIVEQRYPNIGKQIPFALDTLRALIADGHHVILWTVREGKQLEDAVAFCRERGVEFYAVNSMYPNGTLAGTGGPRKIAADVYIDDSNIGGLPDWAEIYQMITHHRMRSHTDSKHHRRMKRKSIFGIIADRCFEARRKYTR